jgi:thymidylate synthase
MKQYVDLVTRIIREGSKSDDRTGTGTIKIFGHQSVYNMDDGFPLLTLKKTWMPGVTHELLWFLGNHRKLDAYKDLPQTNIKYLVDNKVHIWDEWSHNIGDYPNDLRLDGWVKIKTKKEKDYYSGDYSTNGVNAKKNSIDDKLRNQWVKMMKRCYNENNHNFQHYGAKGVFVDKRWHDPSLFIEDVKSIQNWNLKLNSWNDFELDKDYYGANYYSKETCVWLHTSENNIYIGNPVKIKSGYKETIYHSYKQAEKKTSIPSTTLQRWAKNGVPKILKGNNKKYIGIEVSELTKEGYVYRKLFTDGNLGPVYGKQWTDWGGWFSSGHWNGETNSLGKHFNGINQIQEIVDKLTRGHKKFNPMDRGLIVSAWNVGELGSMALRPCHAFFQFQARELSRDERVQLYIDEYAPGISELAGFEDAKLNTRNIPKYELSLQLYQRSADTFLGVPFNIASYALLLHMVCHVTGMKPGKFVHTFGDAHLYLNHKEQVNKFLSRTLNPHPEDGAFEEGEIYDFFDGDTTTGPYYGPKLPTLWLNPEVKNIFEFQYEDIKVLDYKPFPHISAPVAV